jgi:hypothetical protein
MAAGYSWNKEHHILHFPHFLQSLCWGLGLPPCRRPWGQEHTHPVESQAAAPVVQPQQEQRLSQEEDRHWQHRDHQQHSLHMRLLVHKGDPWIPSRQNRTHNSSQGTGNSLPRDLFSPFRNSEQNTQTHEKHELYKVTEFHLEWLSSLAPVAHAWNPSYSGGRNQEDLGLKPASINSSQDPILKKTLTGKKRRGEADEGVPGVGRVQAPIWKKKKKINFLTMGQQKLNTLHVWLPEECEG